MVWNTVLAFVPFGLAVVLFRPAIGDLKRARTPLWWITFAIWIAFLPNSPYVITDVVHLVDDLQRTSADRDAYALLTVYGSFFACGLALYGSSIWLCERTLRPWIGDRRCAIAMVALHGACAVGIYLGRFARVNSWDVVTDPLRVGEHVRGLDDRFPLIVIAMTFCALVVATFVMRATARVTVETIARVTRVPRAPD
jgi:uncharacterized membrane protein